MALSTKIKWLLNAAIKSVNLKVDSLTTDRLEVDRLLRVEKKFGFQKPVYAFSPGMVEFDAGPVCRDFVAHRDELTWLKDHTRNQTGYSPSNNYYRSPDADVLYLMVRRFAPNRVIEVGCGNSTRVTRQAIKDGQLGTHLLALDPQPRADITALVDRFVQTPVEMAPLELFSDLKAGDLLFIDSSHELRVGNDLAHLFCRVIPMLEPGVVIHLHDIFLPYEYPKPFFFDYPSWAEQYILHALLAGGEYDILWPGYFIQRNRPDLIASLPFLADGIAQSFWMQKR